MSDAPKMRGQMAIKSKRLDTEWQLLVKKAAERAGMGIGDFIVEAARARAQAVLKNEPEDGIPAGNPPARLEDVMDRLTALADGMAQIAKAQAEQQERLAVSRPVSQPEPAADFQRLRRAMLRVGRRR